MNKAPWTKNELDREWKICHDTRLGMMCEGREPTPEQEKCACDEADKLVRVLQEHDQTLLL